jgi:hypothetical protein
MCEVFLLCRDHVGELGKLVFAGEALHALVGELHDAVGHGVEGVIGAFGHVQAGADFGAALANNDVSDFCTFARVELGAETLTLGVAAQGCRATCLFMCHRDEGRNPLFVGGL